MNPILSEWRRFTAGQDVNGSVRPVIAESWRRCRSAGVQPQNRAARQIGDDVLRSRLRSCTALIENARKHFAVIAGPLSTIKNVLCLTDGDGVVLYSAGDAELVDKLDCRLGSDWSEQCVGTNGAG